MPFRPIIAPEYPKNVSAFVDDKIIFECPVLSDPAPRTQWYRHCLINGRYENEAGVPCLQELYSNDIVDSKTRMMGEFTAHILTLSNVMISDEGWYTCVAGNQFGRSQRSAYLSVFQSNLVKV